MFKKICIFLTIFLGSSFVFAAPAIKESTIRAIIIEGNKWTRDEVIKTIIRTKVGDPFNDKTISKIKRYLENQRKFAEVKVKAIQEGSDVAIFIYVKDKWSLVLAPYFSTNETGSSYGFIFLESNFLGYQNILLTSVIYEYEHANGVLLYSHPRVLGTSFSYVLLFRKDYYPVNTYSKGNKISSFYREEDGEEITLKYQFWAEHYIMFAMNRFDYTLSGSEEDQGHNRFFKTYLELDWLSFKGFFAKGRYLGLYFEEDSMLSDVERRIAGLKFEQYFAPYKQTNIYFNLHYYYAFKITDAFTPRIGQNEDNYYGPLRGYEAFQLKAKHAFTFSSEYRIPLGSVLQTETVIAPFFDTAFHSGAEGFKINEFDYTAGLALRVYFKEILVPAIQFFAGYGFKYENFSLGFSIGSRL